MDFIGKYLTQHSLHKGHLIDSLFRPEKWSKN